MLDIFIITGLCLVFMLLNYAKVGQDLGSQSEEIDKLDISSLANRVGYYRGLFQASTPSGPFEGAYAPSGSYAPSLSSSYSPSYSPSYQPSVPSASRSSSFKPSFSSSYNPSVSPSPTGSNTGSNTPSNSQSYVTLTRSFSPTTTGVPPAPPPSSASSSSSSNGLAVFLGVGGGLLLVGIAVGVSCAVWCRPKASTGGMTQRLIIAPVGGSNNLGFAASDDYGSSSKVTQNPFR